MNFISTVVDEMVTGNFSFGIFLVGLTTAIVNTYNLIDRKRETRKNNKAYSEEQIKKENENERTS